MPGSRLVAGVDGCRDGWIAAVGRADGSLMFLAASDRIDRLFARFRRIARWAIDMPIGLSDCGRRDCDSEARSRLGARASTLFNAPPYLAIDAKDYSDARRVSIESSGKSLSRQAWNLCPKIREVREAVCEQARLQRRVFESHPEHCFARMNEGSAVDCAKRLAEGEAARIELLAAELSHATVDHLINVADAMSGVRRDDALDALACWTAARRHLMGEHATIPSSPGVDRDGLALAISW